MTSARDELIGLGDQLRQAFADERSAIGTLDHTRLVAVADTKRELVARLSAFDLEHAVGDLSVRDLFITLRAEARATAMLASTANAAVRMLLGYEVPSYDRRARPVTQGPSRILAAY